MRGGRRTLSAGSRSTQPFELERWLRAIDRKRELIDRAVISRRPSGYRRLPPWRGELRCGAQRGVNLVVDEDPASAQAVRRQHSSARELPHGRGREVEQLRHLAAVENIVARQLPSLGFHDRRDYAN